MRQRKYFRTKNKNNLDPIATKLEKFKGYVNMLAKVFISTSVETYISETSKCK